MIADSKGLRRGIRIGFFMVGPVWIFATWAVIHWGKSAAYVVTGVFFFMVALFLLAVWAPWETIR